MRRFSTASHSDTRVKPNYWRAEHNCTPRVTLSRSHRRVKEVQAEADDIQLTASEKLEAAGYSTDILDALKLPNNF